MKSCFICGGQQKVLFNLPYCPKDCDKNMWSLGEWTTIKVMMDDKKISLMKALIMNKDQVSSFQPGGAKYFASANMKNFRGCIERGETVHLNTLKKMIDPSHKVFWSVELEFLAIEDHAMIFFFSEDQ
jgi:hypothetical protein